MAKPITIGQGILPINRDQPFDPAKFIGEEGWTIEEQDKRSLALRQLDLTKVRLEHMLRERETDPTGGTIREGETFIKGEEKLKRLKEAGHIRLDAKVFQTLWENQAFIPESWKGKVSVYFDGTVLRTPADPVGHRPVWGPFGHRCVLCLSWRAGQWHWAYVWLECEWCAEFFSAVLSHRPWWKFWVFQKK